MRWADRRGRVNIFYQTVLLSADSGVPAAFISNVDPSHFKVPHGTFNNQQNGKFLQSVDDTDSNV